MSNLPLRRQCSPSPRTTLFALTCVGVFIGMHTPAESHPGATDAAGCHEDARTDKTHCHSKRPAQLPQADDEGVYAGVVRWVSDGDTLHVDVRGRSMEIRLAEVDAPEREQPYGWEAKLALTDLVRNRQVRVVPHDVDRYGRVVAYVYVDALEAGAELVRQGAAWFYADYARSASLYELEQKARAARVGLWALPAADRMEPWQWRKEQREAAAIRSNQPSGRRP